MNKDRSNSLLKTKKEKQEELAGKIEETDDMKLKILKDLGTPDSNDAIYAPELNAHLIGQLTMMTSENSELRKLIFVKDEEIKALQKLVTELNTRIRDVISGTGGNISAKSATIISSKITDLCKQNRHLTAEIGSYKTKNAALERRIIQLEMMTRDAENLEKCACKDDPIDLGTSEELKDLNAKLAVVNKKLFESKNRNLELKNEILVATKILQQELGSNFTSIKDLQNDLAGWKGRATQILNLQSKIAELETKLNLNPKEKKKDPIQHVIRDLEEKKKKEAEETTRFVNALKQENIELKRKVEGAKCRIKLLECEAVRLKQKSQTFMEKSEHDDVLINEQKNQIKHLETYYQEVLRENTSKMNRMLAEIAEHQKANINTDVKIDALRKQANEKSAKIEELRDRLLSYEKCSLQSVFFTPMKTATDNEIKRLSDLVVKQNERIDHERHKWEDLDHSHRRLKEKKRKMELTISKLEEECNLLKAEKENRLTRTKKPRSKSIQDPLELSELKFKKPAIKTSTDSSDSCKCSSSGTHGDDYYEAMSKDELKYKLQLTEERLKILQDKLKMIEEEKQEDCKHLTDMVNNSKKLFNEALTVLQKTKCYCHNLSS